MKYAIDTCESESNFEFETSDITIEHNAKAFDVLMGSIYPDIVKAFVREIITNGWDSHIKSGNTDKPIDIYTPSDKIHNFVVRDYGTGMSDEDINTVYKVMFKSTKDTNNTEAGMFGIGSKTPLGYTTSFMIHCYDGVNERIYRSFKNDQGIPQISKIMEFASDEPTGVKIVIPIETDDIERVNDEMKNFLRFFDAPYRVNEVFDEEDYTEEVIYEDEFVAVYDKFTPEKVFIKMGPILYPLPPAVASGESFKGFINYNNRDKTMVFKCNIGDFRVTSSRDAIIVENDTGDIIRNMYEKSKNNVFNDKFKGKRFKKYREFRDEYEKFIGIFGQLKDVEESNEHYFKIRRYNNNKQDVFNVPFKNGIHFRQYTTVGDQPSKNNNKFNRHELYYYKTPVVVTSTSHRIANIYERLGMVFAKAREDGVESPVIILIEGIGPKDFTLKKFCCYLEPHAVYDIKDFKAKRATREKREEPLKPEDIHVQGYYVAGNKTWIDAIKDHKRSLKASQVDFWIKEPITTYNKKILTNICNLCSHDVNIGVMQKKNKKFSTLGKPIGISNYIKELLKESTITSSIIKDVLNHCTHINKWPYIMYFYAKYGVNYHKIKYNDQICYNLKLREVLKNRNYISSKKQDLIERYMRMCHPESRKYVDNFPLLKDVKDTSDAFEDALEYVKLKGEMKDEYYGYPLPL